jgi:hypothetical protein
MTNQINSINDILESKEFNQLFDIETEQKELQEAGWTYSEIAEFAKGIVN